MLLCGEKVEDVEFKCSYLLSLGAKKKKNHKKIKKSTTQYFQHTIQIESKQVTDKPKKVKELREINITQAI